MPAQRSGARVDYRWVLWLYPASFRQELGDELTLLASELVRDRGSAGRRLLALDLLVAVPRTRWESLMHRSPSPTALILTMAALVVGVLLATLTLGLGAMGAAVGAALILTLLVLAVTQRSALGRAFEAPVDPSPQSLRAVLTQAWWAPIAAFQGMVTLTFAVMIGARSTGDDVVGQLVGVAVALAFGTASLAGLVVRLRRPAIGAALIMVGVSLIGMAYWMVWPPILVVVLWVGVVTSTVLDARRRPGPA